jgi:signal peptidase I
MACVQAEEETMRCMSITIAALTGSLMTALVLPLRPTVVMGQSMAPTLRSGGCYLLNTGYYRHHAIRQGDIVVFRHDGETCAKRVYALPGRHLLLLRYDDNEGNEIVDPREAVSLRRLMSAHRLPHRCLEELVVPPGHCFVMGDNRTVSYDSRTFGCILMSEILGRLAL